MGIKRWKAGLPPVISESWRRKARDASIRETSANIQHASLRRMFSDRFFMPALRMTFLLTVLIIPAQFVLAIIMGLVIQAELKGTGFFLYIFSIALGVSDLAVGILWYSIFTQSGYLNSILQSLGLIEQPAHLPFSEYALLDRDCDLAGGGLAGNVDCDGDRRRRDAGDFSRSA